MFHRLPYETLLQVIECTQDQRTLYRLALTCRALSDVALGRLWHAIDSVVPLLLLMPAEFYDQDLCQISTPELHLPEESWLQIPHNHPCFARMLAYGNRIHVLRGIESEAFHVSYQAFQFLVDYLPTCILRVDRIIPNLTRLSLTDQEFTCNEFSLQISQLLVSSLRSIVFTFDCRGLHEHVDTVVLDALQNCPMLESLTIVCTGEFCEDQESPLLDFGYCLDDQLMAETVQKLSKAAHGTPLRAIQVIPHRVSGYCDIVCTPMTLVFLGALRSVTCLCVSLDTTNEFEEYPLFQDWGLLFPSLQYLRLRLHHDGSDHARPPWFFRAIGAGLIILYLHFVEEIGTSQLEAFMSSLEQFREKFSGVKSLSLRATVYEEEDESQEPHDVVQSMVTAVSRLSPSLLNLKLKLFPSYAPQQGLVRAGDLPRIVGAFPDLRSVRLATSSLHVNLTDIISLARRFPALRTIGMNFQGPGIDTLSPLLRSVPADVESHENELQTLDVRHSAIEHPEQIAGYLRESLPRLCTISKSRKSTCRAWDVVQELLRDRTLGAGR